MVRVRCQQRLGGSKRCAGKASLSRGERRTWECMCVVWENSKEVLRLEWSGH